MGAVGITMRNSCAEIILIETGLHVHAAVPTLPTATTIGRKMGVTHLQRITVMVLPLPELTHDLRVASKNVLVTVLALIPSAMLCCLQTRREIIISNVGD